jgi:hypothetical protein
MRYAHMTNRFESQPSAEPLNEEEAHEEANEIKARTNLDRDPSSIVPKQYEDLLGRGQKTEDLLDKGIEHSATPEEYDEASQEIDALKKLAEEEPDTAKVLYKIGRASFHIGNFIVGDIFKNARELAKENKGKPEEEQVKDFRKELWGTLDDAAAKLKRAKDAGVRYGKAESATHESE